MITKTPAGSVKSWLKRMVGLPPGAPLFLFRRRPENEVGPLQNEEGVFLYGLISVLKPKLAVEFGFLNGYSAAVMLSAMNGYGHLHSYDVSAYAQEAAGAFAKKFSGFFYHHKSQTDFDGSDVENQFIDFVLMDAAHDLEMNVAAFQKLKPFLADESIVMVHDTGLWQKEHMRAGHLAVLPHTQHKWLDEERLAHQIDERRFMNWIMETESDWAVLHFGSSATLRNGFSLLGRKRLLEV